MNPTLVNLLTDGCEQLKLNLSSDTVQRLIDYAELLIKWNKVYNLTSITEPREIIIKHILDSLAVIPALDDFLSSRSSAQRAEPRSHQEDPGSSAGMTEKFKIIDIGTGAGLPGIVLAIVKPELSVTLLDSNNKKTTFLQQVKIQFKLNNVAVINQRVENYIPERLFDAIISRAFASLVDYINVVKHLIKPDGIVYAMKSKLSDIEISEALEFQRVNQLKIFANIENLVIIVPYLSENRNLIKIYN